jgi:chitin-binding protein
MTVKNMPYNGSLAPNATTAFGFTGTTTSGNPAPALTCTSP